MRVEVTTAVLDMLMAFRKMDVFTSSHLSIAEQNNLSKLGKRLLTHVCLSAPLDFQPQAGPTG